MRLRRYEFQRRRRKIRAKSFSVYSAERFEAEKSTPVGKMMWKFVLHIPLPPLPPRPSFRDGTCVNKSLICLLLAPLFYFPTEQVHRN